MNAMSFYPLLKHAHIGLVALSVTFFAVRGLCALAGARWPLASLPSRLSMVIDTALLAAGGTLWWMLSLNPLRSHWLGVKLVLLVVYIVLGALALRRAKHWGLRLLAYVGALLVVSAMYLIARAHDPMAPVRWLMRL